MPSENPYAKKFHTDYDITKRAPRNFGALLKGTRLSVKKYGNEVTVRKEGLKVHRRSKKNPHIGGRRRGRKTRSTRRR